MVADRPRIKIKESFTTSGFVGLSGVYMTPPERFLQRRNLGKRWIAIAKINHFFPFLLPSLTGENTGRNSQIVHKYFFATETETPTLKNISQEFDITAGAIWEVINNTAKLCAKTLTELQEYFGTNDLGSIRGTFLYTSNDKGECFPPDHLNWQECLIWKELMTVSELSEDEIRHFMLKIYKTAARKQARLILARYFQVGEPFYPWFLDKSELEEEIEPRQVRYVINAIVNWYFSNTTNEP